MILVNELKKIFRQIRGEEYMFGYRSTAANQLYLLFCFCGNIYFTDRIHKQVKWLWFSFASWYILLTYYIGLMYALYSDEKTMMKSLYVLSLQILANALQIGLPLICYCCRNDIKDTITQVDKISQHGASYTTHNTTGDVRKFLKPVNLKKKILSNLLIIIIGNFVRLSSGVLDVILFYDEAKLNNYLYYVFFLPKTRKVTNLSVFLLINAVFDLTFAFVVMQWVSLLSFMLLWTIVCHNQLIPVCQQMTEGMKEMVLYVEWLHKPSKSWNRAFRRNLIQAIRKYQKIIRMINLARKFVEIFSSLMLPVAFLRQVTLLHHGLAENVPFCIKITGILGFICSLWTVYLMFWIGEKLQSSVSAVSFAVYSTPWYWSTKVRQDLHVFLSQTQKLKDFPVIKMHPLRFNFLTVYLNGVASSVNILLRVRHVVRSTR